LNSQLCGQVLKKVLGGIVDGWCLCLFLNHPDGDNVLDILLKLMRDPKDTLEVK